MSRSLSGSKGQGMKERAYWASPLWLYSSCFKHYAKLKTSNHIISQMFAEYFSYTLRSFWVTKRKLAWVHINNQPREFRSYKRHVFLADSALRILKWVIYLNCAKGDKTALTGKAHSALGTCLCIPETAHAGLQPQSSPVRCPANPPDTQY